MMQYVQNPEVRREAALYLAATLLFSGIAVVISPIWGLVLWGVCMVFAGIHFCTSYRRYQHIGKLNAQIDACLHGQELLLLDACQEGELAILQSELQKLTIRIRESLLKNQRDKTFLSDSLADISHQLRTPLTSLNLITSMLSATELTSQQQTLTRQLKTLLRRIDWLVEALLKLSKIDAGTAYFRKDPLQAATVLQQAAAPLAVALEVKGLQLQLEGSGSYLGDAAWSAEAFGNLLKNSLEHTPTGGTIHVCVSQTPLYTQIIFHDTGLGFQKKDLPYLFERFYKGENASDNSFGIGLALAQRIISAQNGTIQAKNHPDGGAMFTVRFYKGTI